jgi:class 3 adenylate cyclase
LPGAQAIVVGADGDVEAAVPVGQPGSEIRIAPRATLRLHNAEPREHLFIVERTAWSDQAALAADVTALQVFRDLFANEAIRPGEQISVGSLTILFTDLRGSTRLYREIGDAPAFGLVMRHFDVLREAIALEQGGIVKNLGDAVMAVFRQPAFAVRALLRAQRTLSLPPAPARPLRLKVGVHHGPCIAVNFNDRLDYFGTTVNAASRLVELSTGEDIVLSDSVRQDPEVSTLLADPANGLQLEPGATMLKGFDEEIFRIWRVRVA